ncbi:cyclase family protein [Citrobacter amalonaticus]|uniref:cyclase family protein n=1 Tax=Citrobacter amalonaticus TaxID=35703 RepID=UPI000907DCCF|nr:cyclase family protein [Citrobacter amalonaticus]
MKQQNKEFIELSHVISTGMITFPGASDVEIYDNTSRNENGSVIDSIRCYGTTATYLDAPFHVFPEGKKISDYPLHKLVGLPVVVVCKPEERRAFLPEDLMGLELQGRAVLFFTGNDRNFGTGAYFRNAPFIHVDTAAYLVRHGAAFVGIDSLLVDDVNHPEAVPVHRALLGHDIPIAENLTGIGQLVGKNAELTAVPPRAEMGSFPVRIFALTC